MREQKQEPESKLGMSATFNLLCLVASSLATVCTVFTRHTFGTEALAWSGPGAFFGILLYAGFSNSSDVIQFFWIWLVALIIQRIRTFQVLGRGYAVHSRFEGWPWVGFILPFVKTYRQARAIEIFVCFFAGVFLCPLSEPIGNLFMYAAGALFFMEIVDRQLQMKEIQTARDAEIEMRLRAAMDRAKPYRF